MSWPTASPFDWGFLRRQVFCLIVVAVIIEVCSRWIRVGRLIVGASIACVIAIFTGAVWPLLVSVWFGFASLVVGQALLSALKINYEKLSRLTIFLIGAGAYGTAVGLYAHFPINYPGLYGAALAIPVILGWRSITEVFRSLIQYIKQPLELRWLDLAIALVALIYCCVALMPEVGHDALAMHLFIPGHLAHRHEWGFDVNTYVWAVMPMMGDWLFSIGYMLAGETAARMINVGFIFVLCWLIRDLVMWAGGNAVGARWAVLLFLTTPLTFTESSSLFIESVWASFIVAGSLSIFKLLKLDNDQNIHLPVAGILLGGALATKAVTFTILPVLLFLLMLRYRAWVRRELISALALGLILFLTVGTVPYATAWFLTGSPVFPFFNQIFQSPFYPPINFDSASIFGKGLTWDIFYQATFHTEKFLESRPGATGFQWMLLFFPALLSLLFSRQYRGVILFGVAGLSIALTFQSVTYLRYVFPSFAWLAGGIGAALSAGVTDSIFVRRSLAIVGSAVVVLNLVFFKSGTYYGDISLLPLASSSGRDAYLNSRLPIRNAVELVNRLNVEHTPVAVFSLPLTAGLNSDGVYSNWYNYRFQANMNGAKTADVIAQLLLEMGVDYVILDDNWGEGDKRKMIEEATDNLAELGAITVRKVKIGYRFQTELLRNPDFSTTEGWIISSRANDQSSKQIIVSVSSPAFQVVSVAPGRRYQNNVTAVCPDQPSQGRLQVNWLDSKSNFISTDIQIFDCAPSEASHSQEVIAPRDASSAVVYASGHTNASVIFRKVSFKQ
ncbi:hypothetical protein [Methylobacter sp.]|uniref:hypothetical protein n=1 Tax=Methylobacter sp. TaxID=2051955 RepID=UPI002625C632|nr:hypothetical protein [Methylobacter sp.]